MITETIYRMDVYQTRGRSATRQDNEAEPLYFSRQTHELALFERWREYAKEFNEGYDRTTKYFIGKIEWEELEEGTCLTVNT